VVSEIMTFSELIANSTVTEAIVCGGELPLVTRLSPTMCMCDRWHIQGQCYSNCHHIADHGTHWPEKTAALVVWCQYA
jgi:hypothetical protein